MTDTITEVRELLTTDALVTAAEYKRVIRELLNEIDECSHFEALAYPQEPR